MELITAIKSIKTAAKAAKTTAKVVKKMKKLYEIDQGKRVIFNSDFYSGRFRETVLIGGKERVVPDFRNDDFQIVDRRVTIFATGDRDPFCDASSLSPEKILTIDLLRASVTHDAIYQYMEDIAAAWGWPVEDVRKLADHAHGNDLQHEARKQTSAPMRLLGDVVAHVAHFCTRTFGGIYHRARAGRNAVVAALVLCMAGCAEIPQVFDPSDERMDYTITNLVKHADAVGAGGGSGTVPGVFTPGDLKGPDAEALVYSADAVSFSSFHWDYGKVDGKNAALVAGCEIADLRVTSSGMSYRWASGGCEALGAHSRTDSGETLACLFVQGADGRWRGGKFDWISTSRTSRDWKNIRGGYKGWPKVAIETATAYAFVIVSADGKKRSNVITCGR